MKPDPGASIHDLPDSATSVWEISDDPSRTTAGRYERVGVALDRADEPPDEPPDPDERRLASRLKKYWLSHDEYEDLIERQNGRCAICGYEPADPCELAIDHCHSSDAVRGLLCRMCNLGLGLFSDNRELLLAADRYLARSAERESHTCSVCEQKYDRAPVCPPCSRGMAMFRHNRGRLTEAEIYLGRASRRLGEGQWEPGLALPPP